MDLYFRRMVLSVIIVNYNVKFFLEQCLASVERAIEGLDAPDVVGADVVEVLVVDNCSTDGSVPYLRERFSFARFIVNAENVGFSRANNQALALARGRFVLFLNPDTVVPEDCFRLCIEFMDRHAAAGALGVHMIDGSGSYLPESKRGFPSPWVSFCKMAGLTRLFPSSRVFAQYYLGHLPTGSSYEIDVLSGAFMWVRKSLLDVVGGFDEQFFMYAEDIDLSYRIQQAGYRNYYFADTTIVHFKGESTRRDARYVRLFYTAMIQFVEKHFKGVGAWGYKQLLRGLIVLKNVGADGVDKQAAVTVDERIALTGDTISMREMEGIASLGGRKVVASDGRSAPIVLCIGSSYSFREAIRAMSVSSGSSIFYLHAENTVSAVGSSYKDLRGSVITANKG